MADMQDKDSRTEAPSPKKLADARRKGQIAKSPDLNAALSLLVLAIFLSLFLNQLYLQSIKLFRNAFQYSLQLELTERALSAVLMDYLVQGLIMSLPIAMAMMAVGLAGNLFQTRLLFSTEPLKPDFNRLNPIQGFKNIFSQKAFVGLVKNLIKLGLVGYVSWRTVVIGQLKPIVRASSMETGKLFSFFTGLMGELLVNVAVMMFVLGIADYIYQNYDYRKGLRMTKQETKEEYKAMEGDPRFKQFRRQKQKQLAEQRMMQRVPEATVVITNPTHYAVAVRYDASRDAAPLVVAKGLDLVAENIKKIAKAHDIPMIENRELARRMYRESEIGDEVPVLLYQAMAEILAMVYTLKKQKK